MSRVLFTADIHIKLGQKNVPLDWSINRYKMFVDQLLEAAKDVDVIVFGGDTFDRLPTIDELELYWWLISEMDKPTYIFDGNHEASKKGETFLKKLDKVSTWLNENIIIVTDVFEADFGTIVPYRKIKDKSVWKSINTDLPVYTHVRGEIPPHVKPEIDLDLLSRFPVVFAGDLHAHSNSQRNIVYSGSPMTTSFHRSKTDTGYLLIDGCAWEYKTFNLPQLIRKTVSDPADMVPTDFDHTIYELEGALTDLAGVKDSELLDKKVVKRASEAALILDSNMSVEEELNEYLLYIMELDEEEARELIGVFRDHVRETNME